LRIWPISILTILIMKTPFLTATMLTWMCLNIASYVQYLSHLILKGRAFPLQVTETPMGTEYWDFILNLTLSTSRMAELSAPHAGCTLSSRKFLSTHFCQGLSGPPELFNTNRRNTSIENFQGPRTSYLVVQCLNQTENFPPPPQPFF